MSFALLGVLLLRLAVPLAIPKFPLPAIVAALVVDAGDQTTLAAFDAVPDDYQAYDKALDVYYLAVAYISTLRNWLDGMAFRLSRALWYYRLIGVAIFEFTGARFVLLIFPNTFEYFFIFYEAVRCRWDPARMSKRLLASVVVLVWVGVKLPQEWWIHWARLDMTGFVSRHVTAILVMVAATMGVVWVSARLGPPMPTPDWSTAFGVDAHPTTVIRRSADRAAHSWSPLLRPVAEKLVLVGLVTAVFSKLVPRSDLPTFDIVLGVVLVVVGSSLLGAVLVRDGTGWRHAAIDFAATAVVNLIVVSVVYLLPTDQLDGGISMQLALFLVGLLTLIIALYDRYRALRLASVGKRPGLTTVV